MKNVYDVGQDLPWWKRLWNRARTRVEWILQRLPSDEEVAAKLRAFGVAKRAFELHMAEAIVDTGNTLKAIEPEHFDLFSTAIDIANGIQLVAGSDQGLTKLNSLKVKLIAARKVIVMADDVFDATVDAISAALKDYIADRRATNTWPEG